MRRANFGSDVEDLEKNTKMGKRFQRSGGARRSVAARPPDQTGHVQISNREAGQRPGPAVPGKK